MTGASVRIAVSGLPGTGKTTLVRALADRVGATVIDEGFRPIADADYLYSAAVERNDAANVEQLGKAVINAFATWQVTRTEQFTANDSFIADRWDADLLDWWLVRFGLGRTVVDGATSRLIEGFIANASRLDLAVVTPIVPPFASGVNDEGNGRFVTFTNHVLSNTLVVGLIRRFTTVPVVELPVTPQTVDERVETVLAALERRGASS